MGVTNIYHVISKLVLFQESLSKVKWLVKKFSWTVTSALVQSVWTC